MSRRKYRIVPNAKVRCLWRNAKKEEPVIPPGLDHVRIACLVLDEVDRLTSIYQIETMRIYKPDAFSVPWSVTVRENRIESWCYFLELYQAEVIAK